MRFGSPALVSERHPAAKACLQRGRRPAKRAVLQGKKQLVIEAALQRETWSDTGGIQLLRVMQSVSRQNYLTEEPQCDY